MPTNAKQFKQNLTKLRRKADSVRVLYVTAVAHQMAHLLVALTPYGNFERWAPGWKKWWQLHGPDPGSEQGGYEPGTAKAAWQVGQASSLDYVINYDKDTADGAATVTRLLNSIDRAVTPRTQKLVFANYAQFGPDYNEYFSALEGGHSQQAPDGIIGPSIEELGAYIPASVRVNLANEINEAEMLFVGSPGTRVKRRSR